MKKPNRKEQKRQDKEKKKRVRDKKQWPDSIMNDGLAMTLADKELFRDKEKMKTELIKKAQEVMKSLGKLKVAYVYDSEDDNEG